MTRRQARRAAKTRAQAAESLKFAIAAIFFAVIGLALGACFIAALSDPPLFYTSTQIDVYFLTIFAGFAMSLGSLFIAIMAAYSAARL